MDPIAKVLNQEGHIVFRSEKNHYLGSFVCNILGDRAYLYLQEGSLRAEICDVKRKVTHISPAQIKGGKDGNMPIDELIQLVQAIAAPFLFASYQPNGSLHIFARDFQEIQKNQFLKPHITFPSKYFTCVKREKIPNRLHEHLQRKASRCSFNDLSIPLKRVGKTEVANHYFEEHREKSTHAFWVQAFDSWYFKQDIEKMAHSLQIPIEKISEWLANNNSYLIVFDGVEDPQIMQEYIPQSPKGHILITSRASIPNYNALNVGLFTSKEGIKFLLLNKEGTEEDAGRISQSLGHVPSSLYRAIETMESQKLTLSNYLTYSKILLEKHAEMAKTKSNLPPRNKDFVGREPGLVALEESFSRNKPVVLAANAGLGGIGKTQIAIQYAYRTCSSIQSYLVDQC